MLYFIKKYIVKSMERIILNTGLRDKIILIICLLYLNRNFQNDLLVLKENWSFKK